MNEKQVSKFEMMTTEPVEQLVLRMAVPTTVIMLVSALYNMADTYFVGSLGTSATAAVGLTFSFMALIQAVGFFFGHGSGNYISRALGAQKHEDAEKMAAQGFFTAFGLGVLIALVGTVFMTSLADLLGATPTSLPYARDYLGFILLGAPFMISSLMLNNLLRFQGSAAMSCIGMVSGAVLNIGLDPLFIFVFHLGVKGASLATMISQAVSCILLFTVGCNPRHNVPIRARNFSPSLRFYREMFRGGSPSLFRQSFASLATLLLNHAAGAFGDAAVAAISINNRVFLIGGSIILGLGQGFQPVCGFNYGAKLYHRVKKAFWFCVKSATLAISGAAVLLFAFAPAVIALFRRDDPEVIRIGALAMRFQSVTFVLSGWIVLNNMMLQTIGKAIPASLLALCRQGLFLIPLLFTIVPLLGILGIQICIPIADSLTFLLSLPLGIRALRHDLR